MSTTSFRGIRHAFRPTAGPSKPKGRGPLNPTTSHTQPDNIARDDALLAQAKQIAVGRGLSKDSGYVNYMYRRMKFKEGLAINKSASGGGNKALASFYGNMSRTFDTKGYNRMYGLYQDDGGETMSNEKVMPKDFMAGDFVIHSVAGEIGVLQDVEHYGNDVKLIFQDRSFRVAGDASGWFAKLTEIAEGTGAPATPVAASSAQGPALFKEDVESSIMENPSDKKAKKKIGMDELNKQLSMGMNEEKEHTDNLLVQRKIAIDHLFEDPEYYTKL